MSSTINERRFALAFKAGTDKYKQALKAQKAPNKIKHANEALKDLNRALEYISIIGKKKEEPHIYEFITLCEGMIGTAYLESGEIEKAIKQFNKALEMNKNTFKNSDTQIRELFFLERLMDIAQRAQQIATAEKFAIRIFDNLTGLIEVDVLVDMLLKIKKIFFESKNVKYIEKTYTQLIKLSKQFKGDLEKTKAYVFADYAKYCEQVLNKLKDAINYYNQAIELFEKLQLNQEVEEIKQHLIEIKKK
jgi:tetratricopeptide (TPR) repeat protein